MQYSQTQAYPGVGEHLLGRRFRFLPHALLAGVALYLIGTHHLLLAVVGLIAVLAVQNRMHGVAPIKVDPFCERPAHGEGGSFPGAVIEPSAGPPKNSTVLDGGCLEHRRKR